MLYQRTNDLTASVFATTASTGQTIFNRMEGEGADVQKFLQWIEPCPKVYWAGELNRDRNFVVNTNSDDQGHLQVTVFNPDYANLKFCNMTSHRLEGVFLSYRKEGDVHWNRALMEINDGADTADVDFAFDCEEENGYGYITLKWLLSELVPEGSYEIKVGTECDALGGPAEIDMYDASTLIGAIDLTHPEQYGKALPLNDNVIVGEEVSVIFTEDLNCEKPYIFDIKVTIVDTEYELGHEDLHVICEGRKIGFQLDPTRLDVTGVIGKVMQAEIGKMNPESAMNIYDVNGNSLHPRVGNISFEKTIAELDLTRASTSFVLSADNGNDRKLLSEKELKEKIVSELDGIEPSRIEVNEMNHVGYEKTTATVKILPLLEREGRNLRVSSTDKMDESSVHLSHKLWDISEGNNSRRKLSKNEDGFDHNVFSFVLSHMKILPCENDLEKFNAIDPVLLEDEDLKHLEFSPRDHQENDMEVALLRAEINAMRAQDSKKETQMKATEDRREEEMMEEKKMLKREMKEREEDLKWEMHQMFINLAALSLLGIGVTGASVFFLLKK